VTDSIIRHTNEQFIQNIYTDNMGITSPHFAIASFMQTSALWVSGCGTAALVIGGVRRKPVQSHNQDFMKTVKRQTGILSEVVAESGKEPGPITSKGLNTTPIVWICVILVAVILLVTFCILGHRRQNKRDERAGIVRNDEERRLPQVGIVG
jgi:hypothetical protein